MADAKVELSAADRKIVVDSLALKAASVLRAAKAATNPAIAELLHKEHNAVVVLSQRLSTS